MVTQQIPFPGVPGNESLACTLICRPTAFSRFSNNRSCHVDAIRTLLRRKRGKPCFLAEVLAPHARLERAFSRALRKRCRSASALCEKLDDGATTDANRRQKEQRLQHRYAIALQSYATRSGTLVPSVFLLACRNVYGLLIPREKGG